MSILSEPRFHDPAAALGHVEKLLWPNGSECPHCGATDRIYALKAKGPKPGVRKCGHCRKLFTVTVGTILETSHIPLHNWLQHLHRYVAEFEFRYNNRIALEIDDRDRATEALRRVKGKRLTYRRADS